MQPLVAPLEQSSRLVSDSMLSLTDSSKSVMQLAYKLVKPQASVDPKIQTTLATTIN